jgi:5-methylcytosine-specific restriction endonuclease McrBC regulatory subunit McrC
MGPASYITIAYMFNKIYEDNKSITLKFDVDKLFADYLVSYHPEYKTSDFVVKGINVQYYNLSDLEAATA